LRTTPVAIFFASDFGLADGFVGVVEAKIAALAPSVRVVHLAHDIAPQDLHAGSYVIWSAAPHLPDGSIVLAVVDPGVGSARAAIAARGRLTYVGPDNGLFGAAWLRDPPSEAFELTRDPATLARTFDGRDLFGPSAARLALGETVGTSVDPRRLRAGPCTPTRTSEGEIWTFDRYGNAITTLERDFGSSGSLSIGERTLPIASHFADVGISEPVAYIGSSGLVEIAIRDGSAQRSLALARGARVRLT